jgi:2,5-diketo-D-gluconate reductase A
MSVSDTTKIGNGSIPCIGFGTYLMSDDECEAAIPAAISAGYLHIDTAEYYANHVGIRKGLEAAGADRSKLFITDKVSPSIGEDFHTATGDEIKAACKSNIAKLGMDYVDLLLLHHGMPGPEGRMEHWKAMIDLKNDGIIKYAGVSNWSIKHLSEIKESGLPLPDANQIECHPLCTQKALISYCRENNITVIVYSSLAPATTWRTAAGHDSAKEEVHGVACGEYLQTLVTKYSKSEAQILLKWALQNKYCILPKSTKMERIKENVDLFDFTIDDENMSKLDSFDENLALAWPAFIGNPLDKP